MRFAYWPLRLARRPWQKWSRVGLFRFPTSDFRLGLTFPFVSMFSCKRDWLFENHETKSK